MQLQREFKEYKLGSEMKKALDLLGYKQATPVQELVLDHWKEKNDLCVKAKTGSGKTAAYGIPICEEVDWNINQPQALILVPTRELAVQVAEELNLIGKFKRLKTTAIFGKMSIRDQEISLKQKTHIVVGTPGRVRDLLERNSLRLEEIKYVVIDEADEMFYLGLREQVEDILDQVKTKHRTMLFSATLGEDIVSLASNYMKQPQELFLSEEEESVPQINQTAILVEERKKDELLQNVLVDYNPDSCIIFTNTQEAVDRMENKLRKNNYPCRKLHGGLQQKERLRVMEQFKRKEFRYLIATDVAARGIDIKEVSLVINYDMAKGGANYTHRIGRTGRNGACGQAVTFYTEMEEARVKELERYTEQTIERKLPEFSKDRSAQKAAFLQKMEQKQAPVQQKGANVKSEITKVFINAGKKSKIRTCEIVASICGIEGVVADDIGVIEITEQSTFVEILNQKGNLVLKELPKRTIKGRTRKVYRAKSEQAEGNRKNNYKRFG